MVRRNAIYNGCHKSLFFLVSILKIYYSLLSALKVFLPKLYIYIYIFIKKYNI